MSGIRIISTERYVGAHGRGPWGVGTWAFDVEICLGHAEIGRETLWAPRNILFSQACRWVRREIKRRGWTAYAIEVAT